MWHSYLGLRVCQLLTGSPSRVETTSNPITNLRLCMVAVIIKAFKAFVVTLKAIMLIKIT